jgi:hypothetical protein
MNINININNNNVDLQISSTWVKIILNSSLKINNIKIYLKIMKIEFYIKLY